MSLLRAPWTTWWQDDIPCRFSREEAIQNCSFLIDLLGREWLQKALGPRTQHPLVSEWMTNGANAFLLLNALAEDARLLVSVRGFDDVVKDLRHRRRCRPAWHVIRAAAMFQRGGVAITEFYEQTNEKIPDFSITWNSIEANVEAKLLTKSDVEDAFEEYAKPLQQRIFAEAMAKEAVYPPVTVIVKDAALFPDSNEVVSAARTLINAPPAESRTEFFNIFVDAPPTITTTLFRSCHILCPRSEKENLRVETRVRDASHQLLSDATSERPGILCIGVTQQQDPLAIRDLLVRRFDRGQYPGVCLAILSLSGTHLEHPRRSVVDLLTTIVNPKGRVPLPYTFPIRPLDLNAPLDKRSDDAGIPAYRVMAAETRIAPGVSGVSLPDIRRIAPRALAGTENF
jgi:hypothetical protein